MWHFNLIHQSCLYVHFCLFNSHYKKILYYYMYEDYHKTNIRDVCRIHVNVFKRFWMECQHIPFYGSSFNVINNSYCLAKYVNEREVYIFIFWSFCFMSSFTRRQIGQLVFATGVIKHKHVILHYFIFLCLCIQVWLKLNINKTGFVSVNLVTNC